MAKTFRIACELECCGGEEVEVEVTGTGDHWEITRVDLGGIDISDDLTDKDWDKVHDKYHLKLAQYWDDIKTYGDY